MVKLLFFLPALAVAAHTPWIVGQQVQTTSGIVSGFSSSYATEVSEYRGIRFGETTAGQNRFMAPKRFNSNKTVDAKSFVRLDHNHNLKK
jgi:cholinesterase